MSERVSTEMVKWELKRWDERERNEHTQPVEPRLIQAMRDLLDARARIAELEGAILAALEARQVTVTELEDRHLLPCPFCGGAAERVDIEDGNNAGGSFVHCVKCDASSNVEFEFKENFVSNWNRRIAEFEAAAARESNLRARLDVIHGHATEILHEISKGGLPAVPHPDYAGNLRYQMQEWTEAERAIHAAMAAVERFPGGSLHLTNATLLLAQARQAVARHILSCPPAPKEG